MKLIRPLSILDVETTGLNPQQDKITQVAIIRVTPEEKNEEWETLVNPETEIPSNVTKLTGISNDDVKDKPKFKEIAQEVRKRMHGNDVCGYNVEFDLDFIKKEFSQISLPIPEWKDIVDPCVLFKMKERRTLTAAAQFYLKQDITDIAHNALKDARITYYVLQAQLEKYKLDIESFKKCVETPTNPKFVDKEGKFIWSGDNVIVNFGKKYKGCKLQLVEKSFFEWMLDKDFSAQVKQIARDAISGEYPIRAKG